MWRESLTTEQALRLSGDEAGLMSLGVINRRQGRDWHSFAVPVFFRATAGSLLALACGNGAPNNCAVDSGRDSRGESDDRVRCGGRGRNRRLEFRRGKTRGLKATEKSDTPPSSSLSRETTTGYRGGSWRGGHCVDERIAYRQPIFDPKSGMHIFRPQDLTPCFQGCGDDHAVVNGKAVALAEP